MANTVISAFELFLRNTVNLDPGVTKVARTSRDWLVQQIHGFESSLVGFPFLYVDKDIFFGSFARNTKIRELDDIDLMICLHAQGAHYVEYADYVEIVVPNPDVRLHSFCNDSNDTLNSRRVINKFVSALANVPQYEKAEIRRTHEAAVLKLKTYSWTFDIVPCFFTTEDSQGTTYYIIPDGLGRWKKTDPRKDAHTFDIVNRHFDGNVLEPLRVLKFWNSRVTAPAMSSYLLETIIITYYLLAPESKSVSSFVDLEVPELLDHIRNAIFLPVYDLKGIQGDLNNLSYDQRQKIADRATLDYGRAVEARMAERADDHKLSIAKWGQVFGPKFPNYD